MSTQTHLHMYVYKSQDKINPWKPAAHLSLTRFNNYCMVVIYTGKKSIKTGTATAKLTYPKHMLELTDVFVCKCLYVHLININNPQSLHVCVCVITHA